jgi:hypothetical protein
VSDERGEPSVEDARNSVVRWLADRALVTPYQMRKMMLFRFLASEGCAQVVSLNGIGRACLLHQLSRWIAADLRLRRGAP